MKWPTNPFMLSFSFLCLLSMFLWACAPSKDANRGTGTTLEQEKRQTHCLQKINEITCVLNSTGLCALNPGPYTQQLRKIFEFYPDELKTMFCQIDRIEISEDLSELGQFQQTFSASKNNKLKKIIKLKKILFEETLTVSQMLTFEEQRFFGSETMGRLNESNWDPQTKALKGPVVQAHIPAPEGVHEPLLMVLTHELGHVIDAHYGITLNSECRQSADFGVLQCPVHSGSYASLSWIDSDQISENPGLKYRDTVADIFNGQDIYIPLEEASHYYASLYESRFVTSYSARSPAEDFAESFLYLFLDRYYPEFSYKIEIQSHSYRLKNKLTSQTFQSKRLFIEDIFQRLRDEAELSHQKF